MIWRSGGNASALRKISSAALYSILQVIEKSSHDSDISSLAYFILSQENLPVLLSNMSDDYDSSIRQLICSSIHLSLKAITKQEDVLLKSNGNLIHNECNSLLGDELSKLLDDSNNFVRIQACATLPSFFHFVALTYHEGNATKEMNQLLETLLFVHLDDVVIQENVYEVLSVFISNLKAMKIDSTFFHQKIYKALQQLYTSKGKELCKHLLEKLLVVLSKEIENDE